MKRALIFLSNFIAAIIFSCHVFGQTTLEEYNYVSKGYKVQIESGLDMKKNYEFEDIDKHSTKERTAELKVLYRLKDGKKEIAAYMIIYKRLGNPTEYLCVPHPKSEEEINDKFWKQLYDGTNDSSNRLQLVSFLLSKRMKW
jgi:hypothetical protein